MADFFPGSRQLITSPAGLPDLLQGRKGKEFELPTGKVELFSISDLAAVLNRESVTMRKWEREGYLPKATFVKPGANKDPRGRRRLYSRAQVEALVRIAQEEGILYDMHRQISRTQFRVKALAAFKEIAGR